MARLAGAYLDSLIKIDKAYRRYVQDQLEEYQLTPCEVAVLLYLYNNAPERDTASDIVRSKGLSKGHVAQAVESLCKKGYLHAVRDGRDRRLVHLSLGDSGGPAGQRIEQAHRSFVDAAERNISAEDLERTRKTLLRLVQNAENLIQKGDEHE